MTASDPRAYALRALREGRVCIAHARSLPGPGTSPHEVLARVTGHHGTYTVGFRSGTWSCTCGKDQPCGHRTAAAIVTGYAPRAAGPC